MSLFPFKMDLEFEIGAITALTRAQSCLRPVRSKASARSLIDIQTAIQIVKTNRLTTVRSSAEPDGDEDSLPRYRRVPKCRHVTPKARLSSRSFHSSDDIPASWIDSLGLSFP